MLRRSMRSLKRSPSPSKNVEAPPKPAKNLKTTTNETLPVEFSSFKSDKESKSTQKISSEGKPSSKLNVKSKYKVIDTSSSESDIEDYLQSKNEIDLNSSFFNTEKSKEDMSAFDKIEKEIFSGVSVTNLSDSDTSDDENKEESTLNCLKVPSLLKDNELLKNEEEINNSLKEGEKVARLNFQKLQDYTKKIEEARKTVEQYKVKQAQKDVQEKINTGDKFNIEDLLAAGESKQIQKELLVKRSVALSALNSSSYETYSDSEQEDWEEINDKQENNEKVLVPKELEITVEMPTTVKKKKGDDLLSAIKRRLNRIRKENQVLIHKVHLLCWVAHGNYMNSILSNQNMMALGLSLIPSDKCYPSGRINLDYLEQIVKWYKRTIKIVEQVPSKSKSLSELLTEQIDKKEAYNKKMLVLIFIIILRALGVDCRLILSLQVESLRPHNSDLHFLGNSSDSKMKDSQEKHSKDINNLNEKNKDAKVKMKEPVAKVVNVSRSQKPFSKSNTKNGSARMSSERRKDPDKAKKSEKSSGDKQTIKRQNDMKLKSSKNSNDSTSKKSRSCNNKIEIKTKESIEKRDNDNKTICKQDESKSLGTAQVNKEEKLIDSKNRKENVNSTRQNDKRNQKIKEKIEVKIVDPKTGLSISEAKESHKSKTKPKNSKNKNEEPKHDKASKTKTETTKSNSNSATIIPAKNIRSKSTSTLKVKLERIDQNHGKVRSKSTSAGNKDIRILEKKTIPQIDGINDGIEEFRGFENPTRSEKTSNSKFEDFYSQMYNQVYEGITTRSSLRISQLDGTADEASTSKPNIKKLKHSVNSNDEDCKSRRHRHTKKPSYTAASTSDSDDYFEWSPTKKIKVSKKVKVVQSKELNDRKSLKSSTNPSSRGKEKINLQKLKKDKSKKDDSRNTSSPAKAMDVTKDIMQLIKGRISEQRQIDRSRTIKRRKPVKNHDDSDDSDYVLEAIKKKYHSDSDDEFRPSMKVKQRVQVKPVKKLKKSKETSSRKVISSDSEYTEEEQKPNKADDKKKKGNDTWLEVFLETEEKWISVDVIFGQVHCVNELYSRASHPVSYVLAWSNDNHLKDITRRYCQNYNTVTRKLRTDSQWWKESLKPFLGSKNPRDEEEDDELNRQQLEKPLPTTISEYKNHPLYALRRHLLKFEALYPPDAPPLGFVRNEPVYSRDCVHVCHSRDIWLKQAKVVKLGEKPYKIVKARPKYDKLSNTVITDQLLEIFGPWQVEDYDPPTAENGIVPRNAFGNVDLFKPSMLPKKCVHLQLPGLNKVARRMNIDCASAIVGFDFHGGWSHPVYDGFVVCEEYEDHLVAAWNIDQEELEQKEKEKYEKRVYGNWKKLIKGLLIKERLKLKYGFGLKKDEQPSSSTNFGGKQKNKSKDPTICTKKPRMIDSSESEDDKK